MLRFLPSFVHEERLEAGELMVTTSFAPEMSELEKLSDFSPELALQAAGPILTDLVSNREFLDLQVLPLLGQSGWTQKWYVAHRHDGADGSYSVQVFVWPPGSATRIHDHSCWGAFCCAVGSLVEERYERLDNGSEPNSAHLREVWRLVWRREDGVSSVLPYEGGIHRVGNPSSGTAISVHLYGPRLGKLDGRDYDPSRDYVCDRL
jgi:predicted metal-dependent enzyme (double-stranded beta helix superfamily)